MAHKVSYPVLLLVFVALGLAWLVLLFAFNRNDNQTRQKSLVVGTTIFPLADIANQIAGPEVEVIQLIPGGASPHSFALTPQQTSQLAKADVLLAIGYGLDDRAVNAVLKIKSVPVVTVSKNIRLKKFSQESYRAGRGESENSVYPLSVDPHYWLSAANAQKMAGTIATTLADMDPDHGKEYQENLAVYTHQLELLENELQSMSSQVKQRSFVAIHDAWSYFAEQYNFNLVAVYEATEGKQPSASDIWQLKQIVKANKITTFFTEPQKQSDASTKLMQQEFGLDVKTMDPTGGVIKDDSYIKLMRRNMRALVAVD